MVRAKRGTDFERCDSQETKVAPIRAISKETEGVCTDENDEECTVGRNRSEQRAVRVIFDGQTALALRKDGWSEAVVCKALRRIKDDVPSMLQMNIKVVCPISIHIWSNLIWVIADCQSPEA